MSLVTSRRLASVVENAGGDTGLATALAAGLLLAAYAHLTLAVEHGVSTFAVLAAIIGAGQFALAVAALRGHAYLVTRTAMVVTLVLMQLYVLNVTVGLPPVIAHTHVPGTHVVLGLTLAWPNPLDAQGLLTQLAQAVALVCAAALRRPPVQPPTF